MHLTCKTFWVPKVGNSPEEYEDAFSQSDSEQFVGPDKSFRCAVGDGATEASFAGAWARLVADGYVHRRKLSDLRHAFADDMKDKKLNWYAEEKADLGSFAAYVGLELRLDGAWRAEAVGDCCLFHVRNDQIIGSFPILNSSDFNNTPRLVSSKKSDHDDLPSLVAGTWDPEDEFLLVSDALAKWMLQNSEGGRQALDEVLQLNSNADLEEFVKKQQSAPPPSEDGSRPTMRNDDVTITHVRLFAE